MSHPFWNPLREIFLVMLVALLTVTLAYQFRSNIVLDVGSIWDSPFVGRIFDSGVDQGATFRWTRDRSQIEFPALALDTPFTLTVRVLGWRPDRTAHLVVTANGETLAAFDTASVWHTYTFPVTHALPLDSGDLKIEFQSDTFVPQDEMESSQDPRALGVGIDWIEIRPARTNASIGTNALWLDPTRPLAPPLLPTLMWTASLVLLYASARYIGLSPRVARVGFALMLIMLAVGLIVARIFVTDFTVPFFALSVGLALLAVVTLALAVRVEARERAVLVAIFLGVVLFKLGGIFYPQFHSSDLLFHVHRLQFVQEGKLFFTSALPDAANRTVPYPPALYVFLSPLAALPLDLSQLIVVANVLLEASGIFVIYFLARRVLKWTGANSTSPALWAAFLYAFNPVSFWIYSWGNHTNIFGQTVALYLLAFLLWRDGEFTRRAAALGTFLVFLVSLAHLGIFLSLLAFLVFAIPFFWLAEGRQFTRGLRAFFLVAFVGIALALAFYYADFANLLWTQTTRFASDFVKGQAVGARSTSFDIARIISVGQTIADELGAALLVTSSAGAFALWRMLSSRNRALALAWFLVALLFALINIAAKFSARYTDWAIPLLAVSGGITLAWLAERGRSGRALALGLALLAFGQTAWLWLDRILFAYH